MENKEKGRNFFLDERHYLIEVLVFVDGLYKTYNKMKRIYAQESAMQWLPWQLKR